MIDVLWCTVDDPETNVKGHIGHSFPDSDENRQTFTQTRSIKVRTGNSYGRDTYQERQEVTTTITYCGYHWEKQNPFQKAQESPKAALERSEDFNEGWEAARKHYDPSE